MDWQTTDFGTGIALMLLADEGQQSPDAMLYMQLLGLDQPRSTPGDFDHHRPGGRADMRGPQSVGLPWGLSPEDAVQAHQSQLQQRIYSHPDPKIRSVTGEVEQVMQSSLKPKEKEKEVERIRKEAGLSKKEMKKEVTGRLKNIYKDAKKEVKREKDAAHKSFDRVIKEAKKTYGKNHPVIGRLKEMQTDSLKTLKQYEQGLGGMEKQYGSLYRSGWAKFADYAMTYGSLALNFIPGVGTAAYWAIQAGKGAYNVSKYGWKNGLMATGMDVAMSGLGSDGTFKLPGFDAVNLPQGLRPGLSATSSALNGDYLGAINGAANVGRTYTGPGGARSWLATVERSSFTVMKGRDTYRSAMSYDVNGAISGYRETREYADLSKRMIDDRLRRSTRADVPKK